MKRLIILLAAVVAGTTMMFAQGAKNIKINEVLTDNQTSLQDEFGNHLPWVELANTSFTSYDVRGMFITTDRSVLDQSLSAPQRIARMSIIPNEEERTRMSAREHLVFEHQPTGLPHHVGTQPELAFLRLAIYLQA